ncbi:MAG: alpha/beta hydrolase fold domain-containing protein [Planctomycetota bacterium]
MRRTNSIGVVLAAWCGVAICGATGFAQEAAAPKGQPAEQVRPEDQTSENTPALKRILERRPEADANKDGILTRQEAQAARRAAEENAGNAGNTDADSRKKTRASAERVTPTQADVAYGPHQRNVLDFWQAKSDAPTPLFVWIHGGGFRGGDKNSIPADLLKGCLDAGISCASINYRLTDTAPYPAQMLDSARAIQFLRSKAKEWNLDPNRFAAGGGSAGSGISQWLGFRNDLADPKSEDPIARQSTRLTCVLPINMQSTYDPRDIGKIVPGKAYTHPALVPFFGRPEGWDWDTAEIDSQLDKLLKEASPINHLTKDDPPAYVLAYAGAESPNNIHHPNFARHLKEAMDKLGIECVLHMDKDFESMSAAHADMVEFLKKQFKM